MTNTTFAADFATEYEHKASFGGLVSLATMRACFPELTHEAFDAALDHLRDTSDEWCLQAVEGRHTALTEELRSGAIVEAGRTFHYVSRRMAE